MSSVPAHVAPVGTSSALTVSVDGGVNVMIEQMLEGFKAGTTYGVKVLVLPKGKEDLEAAMVEDVIRRSLDDRAIVVGRDEARPYPRHSIRNAVVNGYSAFKGGSGKISAFLNKAQEAVGDAASEFSGGGIGGLLAKMGVRALLNSPVTPLHKAPYETDSLGAAIKDICTDRKVVIYVRKAYLDAMESLLFLFQTCGSRLDLMLGDRKQNLLVLFCIREQDVKKELGRQIAELAEDAGHLDIVHLRDDMVPVVGESLADKVRAVTTDARMLLKHIYVYAAASDANVFPVALIRRACPSEAGETMEWLQKAGVLEPVAGDDAGVFAAIAQGYDWRDLRKAVRAAENAGFAEESEESEDEEESDDETEWTSDDQAADDLFKAIVAMEGETAGTAELLFNLWAAGGRTLAGAGLAGRVVQQYAIKGDVGALTSKLADINQYFDESVFGQNAELEADDDAQAGLIDCVGRMKSALDHLEIIPWGPAHGTLGRILGKLVQQTWDALPNGPDDDAKFAAAENEGYLHFLTDRGRMKLVSLSAWGMGARRRTSTAGPTACLEDPRRDGRVSELHAVRRTQMAWFFGTNGEVMAFPLTGIDATFYDQANGITENMSVYMDPAAKWEQFGDYVTAICPFDEPSVVPSLRVAYEGHISRINPTATMAFKNAKAKFSRNLVIGTRFRTASGSDWILRDVFTDEGDEKIFAFRDDATGEYILRVDEAVVELFEEGDLSFAEGAGPLPVRNTTPTPDEPGATSDDWLLLVNDCGLAESLPERILPRHPGQRIRLDGPLLGRVRPARWVVRLRPADDLFIATTGNQILRLKAADVMAEGRTVFDNLVALDEDEAVAAVAVVQSGSKLSSLLFIATAGGYGRMVETSQFVYGKIGGKGVIGQKEGKRSGAICTIEPVGEGSHFILATENGAVARIPRSELSVGKRTGVGLKLFPLDDGDRVVCGCTY